MTGFYAISRAAMREARDEFVSAGHDGRIFGLFVELAADCRDGVYPIGNPADLAAEHGWPIKSLRAALELLESIGWLRWERARNQHNDGRVVILRDLERVKRPHARDRRTDSDSDPADPAPDRSGGGTTCEEPPALPMPPPVPYPCHDLAPDGSGGGNQGERDTPEPEPEPEPHPSSQHNSHGDPGQSAGTEGTHSEGTSDMLTADQILDEAARRVARTNEFNGRGVAGPGAIRKLRNEAALHRALIDEWTARGSSTSAIADALAERVWGNQHAAPRDLARVHCDTCDGTGFVDVDAGTYPNGRPRGTASAHCPTCRPDRSIA